MRQACSAKSPATSVVLSTHIVDDVEDVCVLHITLTGWQTRSRLQMLARLNALEPLVAWYAR